MFSSYKQYFKELIVISLPLILGNLSQILLGAGDVLVASRHSTETLAAISIANSVMVTLFIAGIGLMAGITPVISNYLGAGQASKKYLFSTINYALLLAIIVSTPVVLVLPLLDYIGFDRNLLPVIKEYIFIVSFSNIGGYVFFALKEFLQAYKVLNLPNFIAFLSVFLNLVLNIIFTFGFGIIPAMGAKGLAIATLLVRSTCGLILFLFCLKMIDFKLKFDKDYIKQLFKVGYPISIAMLLEFFGWNIITIIMSRVSNLFAAAQSILITITSATYMVPLAISNAMAIKVGYSNGAKNYLDIKRYSISGCIIGILFMTICALVFLSFPKHIAEIFTTDETLISICIPIIIVAAFYQIFDGLQVTFSGILKGLKKTLFVTLATLFGYWFVGIPLGALLAFKFKLNLLGFWIGLAITILTIGIAMGILIKYLFKKLKAEY